MRAAIYTRISDDREGRALGVDRQEADCRALAKRLNHDVVDVYSDNDISASTRSRKLRPDYRRLLADAASNRFDVIIAATSSRITRKPREFEDLIELAENYRTRFEYDKSPRFDLNTADGRMMARMMAAADAAEAERISERVLRKLAANASEGKHHGGSRPYGWNDDRVTPREDEARVLRDVADRILRGEPMGAIVRYLNGKGFTNASGKPWTHATLRGCILRARHAGLRVHNGQIVGKAEWDPIIDPDDWKAVERVLMDPKRVTTPGRAGRIHLLSGIARCAVCEGPLHIGISKGYEAYRCKKACVSRRKDYFEDFITKLVKARVSQPDAADLLSPPDDGGARLHAEQQAERIRQRLDEAAAQFAADEITGRQLKLITEKLKPELAKWEAAAAPPPDRSRVLGKVAGAPDIEERWETLTVHEKRAVIDLLVEIRVQRAKRGNVFNVDGIDISWR